MTANTANNYNIYIMCSNVYVMHMFNYSGFIHAYTYITIFSTFTYT